MIWSYAWRNFIRRKNRAVLAISGLAVSIAMLVAIASITDAVRSAVGGSLSAAGADLAIDRPVEACPMTQVKLGQFKGEMDASVVAVIDDINGVENVTGVLDLWVFQSADLSGDTDALKPAMVIGVDPRKKSIGPVRVEKKSDDDDGDCCAIKSGRFLTSSDDFHVMLTEKFAADRNLALGDRLPLGDYSCEVVALLDLGDGTQISTGEVFIPLKTAQKLVDRGEIVTTIFVSAKDRDVEGQVIGTVQGLVPGAKVLSDSNVDASTSQLASITQSTLLAISMIVLTLVLILVAKTALASVAERVSEIGILKATGWRDWDVSRLLTAEALYAGVIGGAIGTVLGIGLAYVYGHVAAPMLPDTLIQRAPCSDLGAAVPLPVSVVPDPMLVVGAISIALVIGCLSGFLASRRAAKLDPADALRQL